MSNKTENNSGPGGLVLPLPIGRDNRSPIATGAASSYKKLKSGIIYKVINLINGKVYVGKTTMPIWKRKLDHFSAAKYRKYKSAFHNAINKYGKENFKWEIIDRCLFENMLNDLEIFYIKKINCKIPHGYNMTDGGEGNTGYIVSEETKKKLSEFQQGEKHWNYGKHPSIETLKKISGENNHNYGKTGENNWMSKKNRELRKQKQINAAQGAEIEVKP